MSEERFDRIELEQLAKRVRENEATIDKLVLKLNELARFSVSVDERVEELGESVTDLRLSNPGASAKAADRSLDRMRRQSIEFRQERRASLLRR
jgi:hypothetical protein